MRPRLRVLLAMLALLVPVAAIAQAPIANIDAGQLNWRITDAERRMGLAEQKVQLLAGQLTGTTQKLTSLENRFSQLVALLDRMTREQKEEAEKLSKKVEELEKRNQELQGSPPPQGSVPPPAGK